MKAARLLETLILFTFLLTSCVPTPEEDAEVKEKLDDSFVVGDGAQVDPPAPNCFKDVYEAPKESITRKLDILIIPDTSASIKEERKRIAEGFDYFVGALPSEVDFNIGVILGHSEKSNKSGKLYKKNSSDPLVLKSNELSLDKIKDALSLKIHKPKTDGASDGGEMGMASLLNALKGDNLNALKANGLLRDDAALAVIFVADEQDICAKAPEGITLKVDPQNGERKSFSKYCIEENIKWKNVVIGGDYTYKITPQIVLDKLKEVKGDMPLVVGGVLYDELSQIPTGNEDEIGYGYLETIRLAKGINVDLASGDYRDGLTRLGKLATTSFDAPQSFDLSVIPDPASIEAFVDDISVAFSYDSLANKVFLSEERSHLSTARIEYCEKANTNTPPVISLSAGPLEGIAPLEVSFDGSNSSDDKEITSYSLLVEGKSFFNNTGVFTYTFTTSGEFEAIFKATDAEGLTSSESLTFKVNPAPIAPVADFTISKSSERAPSVVTIDASPSTDADGTIESFSLSVNGVETTQSSPVFTFNADTAQSFNLILTVTDSQGLTNQKTGSFEILPALIAPIASFSVNPESGRVPLDVIVDTSSSSDSDGSISKYDLFVNGVLTSQTNPIFNLSVDNAATYNLRLVVTDNDGLTNESSKSVTYEAPLVAPVAKLSATPSTAEVPFEITLDASASTDADGTIVSYVFSDGTNVVTSTSPILTFIQETPGTYNYTVEITDNDGLKSTAEASVIAKPKVTEDPSALLSYFKYNLIPTGDINYNLELIFEGRSLNGKSITEAFYSTPDGIRVDVGRRVLGHVDIIPVTFNPDDAPINITLKIVDELGGSETFSREINPNNPRALLFVDAIEYAPNSLVFFSNKFHDPYGQLDGFASFEIDFGDGNSAKIDAPSFQTNHIYENAGDYQVTISALGENGESFSVTDTVSVLGEKDSFDFPLADFRVEKADFAPGVRLYVDQSLSPNAPIITYLWDLGDGTTAFGPEVVHFYRAGGYDVTLTAILEDGSQSLVKREVIIMNDAPNIVSNLECFDIGNLTLECEFIAADKFNDLASLNVHFGDSPLIPENIISQSVSGGFETLRFSYTYESSGNYNLAYQVQTGRGEELLKFTGASVSDAPGNLPPVADLGCFTFFDQVDCQAFGSFDPDGFITQYKFSFGNGESLTTDSAQTFYTYPEVGTYTVTLEVVDNFGTTSSTTQVVTLEERINQFPVPNLSCVSNNPNELTCDARGSFDSDGTIALYRMTALETGEVFETSVRENAFKTFEFQTSGNKQILIEVTDNDGAVVEESRSFFASQADPPQISFSCVSNSLGELFCDASATTPGAGSITEYIWNIEGVQYNGSVITATGLTLTSTMVELRVINSFGEENVSTGFFDVLQNSAPIADFSCSSNTPDLISCSSLSTDVDNNIVSYHWVIEGIIYSGQEISNIQIGGSNNSLVVFHEVDDGFVSSEISKEVGVLRNTPPQLSISCNNVKPFVINCNSLVSDAENTPYQMSWYFNGEPVGNGKELNNAIFYGEEVNVTAKLTDDFGLTAQASLLHTLELPDLTPSIYCKNIENQILDCAQVSTLIKPDETTYSWTINGELVSSQPVFEIPYDISSEIRVDLTITTLGKTFSSSAVVRPLSTPLSPVDFLLSSNDTFLPLETNLSLQVSGGELKLGEGNQVEVLSVEVNEQSVSLDNQIDVISGSLNVPITLNDGVNIVTISSLDSISREVSSTFTLFAGSRVVSITNQLGSSGEIALFFPELNDLVIRKELNERAIIENVPNQGFLASLLGEGVQIKEVLENETEVVFGDQATFQSYNTSNLDLLGGLEGWELLRGSYDLVDLGVSRFQTDLNGEFELLKTHLVTEEEHIGIPISYNPQGKALRLYVLYENLTKNKLIYKAFDERDLYDNINQSAFPRFFGANFDIGDQVKIHLYLKEVNDDTSATVFNHNFLDHLVDVAFAQAGDINNQINLGPIQTKGFLVTNARLLDGTGSGKGEGLYTIPSAPFSPSYPPSLPDGVPSFDPINGVDHYRFYTAQVSFNFFDPDGLYGEHIVSLLANGRVIGETTCLLSKVNVCPIRLFEKDLNITSPFVELSLGLKRFGVNLDIGDTQRIIMPEEIDDENNFYVANSKKFRVLASLTGFLSQGGQPIYRYDPEKQNEINEGMKDWVLRSHLGLFSQLLNRTSLFKTVTDSVFLPPRFSDLSFLGSTKDIGNRKEHAKKPSHHGGLDADIRFVEGAKNEVETTFYRGSDKDSSKYLSDFNAIYSILNDQYDQIFKVFIQNKFIDKKRGPLEKFNALNENPGNVLLDNMAASCIRNQPALEKINSLDGHKNHFHIRFHDYLEEGRFNTDDPNGQVPIVPEAVEIVSESKVVNLGNYFIKEHLLNPELVNNENKERVRFYYRDNFSQANEGWRTIPYDSPSEKSAFYIVNSGSGLAIRPNYSGIDNASLFPNDKEKLSAYDRIIKARRYFPNGQPNTITNVAPEIPINLSIDTMNIELKVVIIDDTGTSCNSREFSIQDQVPCDQKRGFLPYLSNSGTQKSCRSVLYKVGNVFKSNPTPEQESEFETECAEIEEYCRLNPQVGLACDNGAYLSYTVNYSLLCADGEGSASVTGGYQLSCDSYGNRTRQDFPLEAYDVGCRGLRPTAEEMTTNPRHFVNVPEAIGEGFSFTFDPELDPSLIDLMNGQ